MKITITRMALALIFFAQMSAAQAQDCANWNTKAFFETATLEDVQTCLAGGADIGARESEYGATPLHGAAVANENPAVINALIDAGARVKARDEVGRTPLHYATEFNENPAVINALIDAGADVKARAENRGTPLHSAAWRNENPDVINALIDAGADVNARDKYGDTPLHWAARNNKNPAVISALLDHGADAKVKNEYRKIAYDYIDKDSPLHRTDAFWRLNEARFE